MQHVSCTVELLQKNRTQCMALENEGKLWKRNEGKFGRGLWLDNDGDGDEQSNIGVFVAIQGEVRTIAQKWQQGQGKSDKGETDEAEEVEG